MCSHCLPVLRLIRHWFLFLHMKCQKCRSSCTLQIGVPFSTSGCFIASGVLLILKRSYLEYHLSCRLLGTWRTSRAWWIPNGNIRLNFFPSTISVRYRSELAHLFRRLILLDEIALYAWDSPVSFLSTSAGVVKLIQILQSSEKLEAESDLQPGKPPSHTVSSSTSLVMKDLLLT